MRHLTRRPGQALVELAIVLPVMLVLLGGLIEFGRLYHQAILAEGAARAGARVAATGGTDAAVQRAVGRYTSGLDATALQVAVSPSTRTSGQAVTVAVAVPVTVFTPLISAITGPTVTVRGQAVMKAE